MKREPREPKADDIEVGEINHGGSMGPVMILHATDVELHVYQRPRAGGKLDYVLTMPIPADDAHPVITGVTRHTWMSGEGLNELRDQAARLWRASRPRA